MFAPFVSDESDPLVVFNDAVVHASCFYRHPLAAEATKWSEAFRSPKMKEHVCDACGRPVMDPDDYFTTGLLTRAPDHPLFEFNFVCLHLSHADSWPRFDEFVRRMEATQAAGGSWRGPTLVVGTARPRTLDWVDRKG